MISEQELQKLNELYISLRRAIVSWKEKNPAFKLLDTEVFESKIISLISSVRDCGKDAFALGYFLVRLINPIFLEKDDTDLLRKLNKVQALNQPQAQQHLLNLYHACKKEPERSMLRAVQQRFQGDCNVEADLYLYEISKRRTQGKSMEDSSLQAQKSSQEPIDREIAAETARIKKLKSALITYMV